MGTTSIDNRADPKNPAWRRTGAERKDILNSMKTWPRLAFIGALLAAVLLLVDAAPAQAAVAPSGFTATRGDTQVTLTWNNPGDNTITGYQVLQVAIDKLVVPSTVTGAIEAGDRFGDSVGIAGNRAVVGAPFQESLNNQNTSITNGGWGHTFSRGSGGWSYDEFLAVSNPQVEGRLGSSVAVAGSTVMAGAPSYHQTNNTDPGEVTIASKSSLTGSWATEFTKTGQVGNDLFGYSVALDTGIAVIGAPGALIGSDALAGKAYLYTKNNNVWGPAATAIWSAGTNAGAGTIFGSSVAVDSNTVVIGSPGEDSGSGAAYVFTKTNNVWSAVRLTASDRANADSFGRWVAVDGDFVVVGAWQDDDGGTDSGSVYVFTKPSGGWVDATETVKLTASDAAEDDHFGWSVSVDGDNVVVGAYGNDDDGTDSGSVYLFTKPSGGWVDATETVKLTAPDGAADDNFGDSVAAGGGRVIVGAPGDESDTGAAYVFSIPTWSNISNSDKNTTSHTVTGLDNDVEYTFLIRPVDSGGPGPASGSKHAKPQQAPAATPANLTAAAGVGEVTLSWDDPNDSTITAYEYRQKEAGGSFGQWTTIPDSAYGEANTTGYTVRNLTNGQTYTFRLRAEDEDGDTANSGDVTVTTILAAPTNLTATVGVGAGQIALDWDNPNNTLITKYQYSTNGGTSFTDIPGSDANTTEYTVTGLGNGTEYTLAVRAVNASVNGEAATVTATTRLPPVPLYVSNIGQPTDTSVGVEADLSSDQAQGFRTGTNGTGYVLGSIDVHFQSPPGSGVLTVTVREPNDDAEPGDAVHTLTNPDTIESGFVRFTALDNAQLAANTFYFVHLTFGGAGTIPLLRTTASDALDFGTATGWTMNDYRYYLVAGNARWFTYTNALKISINEVLDAPGAPANLEATVGDGLVVLSWDDPLDDYITKYQYSTDSGASYNNIALTAIDSSATDKFKYTIKNLPNGVTYNLALRAVNASEDDGGVATATALMIPAAPASFSAMAGDKQVQLTWDDPSKKDTIDKYELLELAEESGLIADDAAANDRFGVSVAVDGDTAVVGAFQRDGTDSNNNTLSNAGAAYVYAKDSNDVWVQQTTLTASDAAAGDEFGISVAVDGDTVVVGARGNVSKTGAIYVFTKPSNGGWGGWDALGDDAKELLTTKRTAGDGAADDLFGASVALYGASTIVVGAPGAGSAYVFTKNSGVWTQAANLTATDAATGDEFGISVAVDDDTIAVGAYGKNGNSLADSGLVYVFVKPEADGAWATTTETVQLRASDRAANDNFGRSVAVDTDTIVVGASGDRNTVGGTEVSTGSAYVFARPDTGWANSAGTEMAKLTASDGAHGDQFGRSVAVDGDTIVVGAHQNDDDGVDSGSIYVFIKPTNGWTDTTGTVKLTASNAATGDRFGIALALDGDTALVAAPRNDANDDDEDISNDVLDAGSAYVIGTLGWSDIEGSGKDTTGHMVSGLTNNITYTFAVRAVNNTGDGPASIATATPMPVPAAPLNLSAAPGDGQVALSWTDPDPEDDTITGYKYSTDYVINGGGNGNNGGASFNDIALTTLTAIDENTSGYTVTGLANGVTHTLALRAVNAFGNSMPATVTALMVPAAPELSAAAGDTEVALSWPDPGNDTIEKYQVWQHTEIAKLVDSGGAAVNDEFGSSVAVDGNTAVIGAPNDASDGVRGGAAFVVTRDLISGAWSDPAKLSPGGLEGNDNFGISVALDGNTLVVGASGSMGTAGSVYVYTRASQAGDWSQAAKLVPAGVGANDEFGHSVAVDGVTVVAGARLKDDGTVADAGAAYVFTEPDNGWGGWGELNDDGKAALTANLTAAVPEANDYFGVSVAVEVAVEVAVDGDTVLVGASGKDGNKGAVYAFNKPVGGWAGDINTDNAAKLQAAEISEDDYFGSSLAMDGDTAVIGAEGEDAVYVFTKVSGSWDEGAKLTASDGEALDNFAGSVAVDGDVVVVGADGVALDSARNAGAAYIFTKPANGWTNRRGVAAFTASDGASPDKFGGAVAVSGDTVLVGAEGADQSNFVADSGAAYVFDIEDWKDIDNSGRMTTSHTVTGLTNYQEYWFRVRADNRTGPGPGSHATSATPRLGKPDKPTGLSAKAGDAQVTLKWADPGNDTITQYQVSEVVSEARLTASDGAEGDQFGISVAVDGNTAVVGAFREDDDDNGWVDSGAAYVFTRVDLDSDWSQAAKLTASDGAAGDQFGWSVGVEGGTIVVGAYRDEDDADDPGDDKGSAYVFVEPSGGWADTNFSGNETAKLTAPDRDQSRDGGKHDLFGVSVAVDGDTVVVGAPFQDYEREAPLEDLIFVGAVYVFTEPSDGWDGTGAMGTAKLTTPTSPVNTRLPNDLFGSSVAVDGVTILIGSFTYDDSFERNGHGRAYIFTKPDGGWVDSSDYITRLTASDGAPGDWFGYSVALDSDTAVIGARLHNDPEGGAGSGAAYIFTRESRAWSEKAKLTASDAAAGDNFGYSVAVDVGGGDEDDTVVVGAWLDDDNGSRSGSAYVFAKPAIGWAASNETLKLTAPDGVANDRFGTSVAVEGEQAMVGAYKADHAGVINSGSVYMLGIPDWEDIADSEAKTTAHTVITVPDREGPGPTLTNGAEYNFQIRALNESGGGPASNGVKATPLGKPNALGLGADPGDTQVRLRWTAPTNDGTNAPITGYQYQYRQKVKGGSLEEWDENSWVNITDSGATTTAYTVTMLFNDTEYEFRVQAVTVTGESDPEVTSGKPIGKLPETPENLGADPGDTQVRLTWDDPRDFSINYYQYQWTGTNNTSSWNAAGSQDDWILVPKLMGQTIVHRHTVTGLTNGITYTFRVRAVDDEDDVPGQYAEKTAMPRGVSASNVVIPPGAPTELKATGGHQKVELTWDYPDDASIDGYEYRQKEGASDSTNSFSAWMPISNSDANTVDYVVTGLTNGIEYTFVVQAVDLVGVGVDDDEFSGASNQATATPMPGQPSEPENLAARKGDSQVTLTWQHPDTTGAPITKYEFVHLLQTPPLQEEGDDKFGYAVAVDGDTAVIGAYQDDREDDATTDVVEETVVDAGSAYVFTRVEGVWEKRAKLTASDGEAYDNFGISVAVSGDTIVIGASGDDGAAATDSGSVYVFVKPASNGAGPAGKTWPTMPRTR